MIDSYLNPDPVLSTPALVFLPKSHLVFISFEPFQTSFTLIRKPGAEYAGFYIKVFIQKNIYILLNNGLSTAMVKCMQVGNHNACRYFSDLSIQHQFLSDQLSSNCICLFSSLYNKQCQCEYEWQFQEEKERILFER